MQCRFKNILLVLLLLSIALIGLNIILLWKHDDEQRQRANSKNQSQLTPAAKTQLDIPSLHFDQSKEYKILPNVFTAQKTSSKEDVTLVTHCTANHLHHLIPLSARWTGQISIAVLVPRDNLELLSDLIHGLRQCDSNIKSRVTFHLVLPMSHLPEQTQLNSLWSAEERITKCDKFLSKNVKSVGISQNYANVKIPYPNNLLRNVAWKNSKTDFIFVVDIDMVCNQELHDSFIDFATRNKLFTQSPAQNIVYVIPAFEVKNNIDIPKDKAELIGLWDDELLQPFYYQLCWHCQKHTNYEEWKRLPLNMKLDVAYTVEWKNAWEPFYIAPRNVPQYDERFKQYGFNRISQVCETHIAGYSFHILNNAFLVHQGFKLKDGFHTQKDAENSKNRLIFRQLKNELKTKYPHSQRRC